MSLKKKVVWLPYDFDTAIGINNDGELVFDYQLEDIDYQRSGAPIFNGQDSVIWKNIRAAFGDELRTMYQNLRSSGALSYDKVEQMFEEHQSKWSEAIFNEDAQFKYIDPFVNQNANYLYMLLGSKAEQRKWWLYNRFRYIDSKYIAGDARSDSIFLRPYAAANITVTPYADIYATIAWDATITQERASRNVPVTLICPYQSMNGNIVNIYSSSQLALIGDLSGLQVGQIDISSATRLQALKVGSSASGYDNSNLYSLTFGNNVLLKVVDVRNCSGLGDTSLQGHTQTTVDLSGCSILEEAYFDGTKIQGVTLPNGGVLKALHLPATITNLTIMNQKTITDLTVPSYTNISTLRLENVPTVNTKAILNAVPASTRVRLIGFYWEAADATEIEALLDRLDTMRGLDESGNNVDTAQVSGTIHTSSLTGAQIASYNARYPYLTVAADHTTSYLYYYNYDGTQLLYTETIQDGGDGTYAGQPSRASTAANTFTFAGWSRNTNQYTADTTATKGVVADRNVYAAYTATGRTYTVRFYNGTTLLSTVNNVPYGTTATYTGTTPVDPEGNDREFEGWSPSNTNIQGNTDCYAQYASAKEVVEITDDWATIISNIANGTATYKVGNYKPLDLGTEGTVNMQIAGVNKDGLASGSGTAKYSWISMELLATSHRMNPANEYGTKTVLSWSESSNAWTSQNRYTVSQAEATWTITATEAGTITVAYKTSNGTVGRNKITSLTVNGTSVVTNYANTTGGTYDVAVAAGDTVTVHCEYDLLNASYNYYATITLSGTGAFSVAAEIESANTRDTANMISGTGAIGGWTNSEMRTYMRDTIKPLIPTAVRSAIKEVTKTQPSITTSGSSETQTTTDDVWIPSYDELFGTSSKYKALFENTNNNRIKYKVGASSASQWWLRSANYNSSFNYVNTSGGSNNINANTSYGVALGFCI